MPADKLGIETHSSLNGIHIIVMSSEKHRNTLQCRYAFHNCLEYLLVYVMQNEAIYTIRHTAALH